MRMHIWYVWFILCLQHISTNLQVADIFTKALGVDKLRKFRTDLALMIAALPSLRGEYNNRQA